MIHAAAWILSLIVVTVAGLVVLWFAWWLIVKVGELLGMLIYGVCMAACTVVGVMGCVVMSPWNATLEIGRRIRRRHTRGRMATPTAP